jgi:hypothetical protein
MTATKFTTPVPYVTALLALTKLNEQKTNALTINASYMVQGVYHE